MKSTLLFYQKLVSDLKRVGFELNPYDLCVANKISKGEQLTVCWHVDDLKISHEDKQVVSQEIKWFKMIYGEVCVSQGTRHNYLGMDLDYLEAGKIKSSMVNFLKKTLNEFPEEITGFAATSETEQLLNVRDDTS